MLAFIARRLAILASEDVGMADGARSLGHGAGSVPERHVGYDYPHDDPRGWVPQEYRPPEVAGRIYYEPSELGAEQEVAERMRREERSSE